MLQPRLDFERIQRDYPRGYERFKQRYGHGTGLVKFWELFYFFDEEGILLNVHTRWRSRNGPVAFCFGEPSYIGEVYKGEDNSGFPMFYDSRQEAEVAALTKAFQILHERAE